MVYLASTVIPQSFLCFLRLIFDVCRLTFDWTISHEHQPILFTFSYPTLSTSAFTFCYEFLVAMLYLDYSIRVYNCS
jgi:hypothetical protein